MGQGRRIGIGASNDVTGRGSLTEGDSKGREGLPHSTSSSGGPHPARIRLLSASPHRLFLFLFAAHQLSLAMPQGRGGGKTFSGG